MRLACGFALLLIALSFAGKADAAQPPLDREVQGQWVTDSLQISESFFGRSAPCEVQVYAASTLTLTRSADLDPERWSVQALTMLAPWVDGLAPCAIWLSANTLRRGYAALITLCSRLVHEFGHMLGFQHDDDTHPGSVMNAQGQIVYACYRHFLPRGQGQLWRRENPDATWAQRP